MTNTPTEFAADSARADRRADETIAIIGLGYVGLPIGLDMADRFVDVIGFDISARRVAGLRAGTDATGEAAPERLASSRLVLTDDVQDLARATFFIVTVPTPINEAKRPDLTAMRSACDLIGPLLKPGDVVVFESTVYPGVTEEVCAPILEARSGLRCGADFNVGYSPERISPGDKTRALKDIVKVVAADTPQALDRVAGVYEDVITAGVHRCNSIKVAEASKVLENTQRDLNIALMNELAMICGRLGINTSEVLDAAATKWNFQRFTPGLVGGHCIGVDPYYLASLSEALGHSSELIMAARRVNESVAGYVASSLLKLLTRQGKGLAEARIGLFGLSFKENVPDLRNSKSFDVVRELREFGASVLVHDPHADPDEARAEGAELAPLDEMHDLDAMIVAVAHDEYLEDGSFLSRLRADGILVDVKSAYRDAALGDGQLYWAL
ncbi:MAG: nucleotide sugar dehydrogenase [Marinibacterium sp.]|nr:nucleotide sugar dehydrogenase [Marinibacterium sp.]